MDEFKSKIDDYFKLECYPLTITGLCLHLNITRETWTEYAKKEDFSDPVKLAKLKIENYAENKLFRDMGQVTGIIFNLKNNFGWTDKQEIVSDNINRNIEMTAEEAEKIIAEHENKA